MEGRCAIAIDLSPAATFITKNYCTPVDVDELQRTFEELKVKVKPEMDWLYETGRTLYEKSGLRFDELNEDTQLQMEEVYQACVRRNEKAAKPKKDPLSQPGFKGIGFDRE